MANGLKIEVTGLEQWVGVDQLVFDAVKDAMDDIRDDVVTVSSSLAPRKTGKLERSHTVRRYYRNLDNCYFSITYKADNKGFDYATWTHDARYKLGAISRTKQPAHSRFAKGSLKVGQGYLSQVVNASQSAWMDFITHTIDRKLETKLK